MYDTRYFHDLWVDLGCRMAYVDEKLGKAKPADEEEDTKRKAKNPSADAELYELPAEMKVTYILFHLLMLCSRMYWRCCPVRP